MPLGLRSAGDGRPFGDSKLTLRLSNALLKIRMSAMLVVMSALDRDPPSAQMPRDINGLARLTIRERRANLFLTVQGPQPIEKSRFRRENPSKRKLQIQGKHS